MSEKGHSKNNKHNNNSNNPLICRRTNGSKKVQCLNLMVVYLAICVNSFLFRCSLNGSRDEDAWSSFCNL